MSLLASRNGISLRRTEIGRSVNHRFVRTLTLRGGQGLSIIRA